jgi:hypothetical protein
MWAARLKERADLRLIQLNVGRPKRQPLQRVLQWVRMAHARFAISVAPYVLDFVQEQAEASGWHPTSRSFELTTANIPSLDGTLVVIDMSGSTQGRVASRSAMARVEVAAVMAMATAKASRDVDVVIYGVANRRAWRLAGTSVLAGVQQAMGLLGSVVTPPMATRRTRS